VQFFASPYLSAARKTVGLLVVPVVHVVPVLEFAREQAEPVALHHLE
jgi:hypothetical protein